MQKTATVAAPTATWRATLPAYINLMKPHVTVLLLGTTLAAMVVANGGMPALGLVIATLVGGGLAAGSANSINCYWDRDIDSIMSRTQKRTLPAGRVPAMRALIFGVSLGVASFVILALWVNVLSAVLALSAILFYVCIYTMLLKRTTPQNIVIGGAAGSVPVLVGWAAVTNSVGLTAVWMFIIIFLWTPPHFWALSLVLRKDYARAKVPMLPVVRGEDETAKQIILYTLMLLAASLMLVAIHAMGWLYLVVALASGGWLLWQGVRLKREHTMERARQLFWFSNYYLAIIFAAMVLDRVLR